MNGESPRFYTVKEAAEILRAHPDTIRRWVREGRLGSRKLGTGRSCKILISEASIHRFGRRRAPQQNTYTN